RRVAAKREVLADPKYGSQILATFMNPVMESGKKAVAERIVYGALDKVKDSGKADTLGPFENALEAIAPLVEVRSRRVGESTY
ncbi:30S ribosomal protein S7, partial [Pseudomonas aeruginosa]